MRISDWSSDVCSSDLPEILEVQEQTAAEVTSALEAYGSSDLTPRKREALTRFEEAYTAYSENGTAAQEVLSASGDMGALLPAAGAGQVFFGEATAAIKALAAIASQDPKAPHAQRE